MTVFLGGEFMVTLWGGRTTEPKNQVPSPSAKEPPTQGHHKDMGTIQNTAALYLRKSSLDDQVADLQLRVADLERRVPA